MNRDTSRLVIVSALVAASIAAPLLTAHHSQVRLRQENDSLRQQAAQSAELLAESDRLSNQLAQAQSPQTLTDPQLRELLRLRNEVTQLRQAVQDFQRSGQANQNQTAR
jgi:hypothetical protein